MSEPRGLTPFQTVGPYFSIGLRPLYRNEIVGPTPETPPVALTGRVLDGDGVPVPDACLEVWQADSAGVYRGAVGDAPAEETGGAFLGFGRIATGEDGSFRLTMVVPGPTPHPSGGTQAPHLNVLLTMRGLLYRLHTRVYFPGDPRNDRDPVLGTVPADRRATLIARPHPEHPNVLVWDVVLQGERETVFFEV